MFTYFKHGLEGIYMKHRPPYMRILVKNNNKVLLSILGKGSLIDNGNIKVAFRFKKFK